MHGDRLLDALIDKLPAPGSAWPQADRDAWLGLMRSAFDLVYGRDGQPAPRPAAVDLPQRPRLPPRGNDAPAPVIVGKWHIDAGGIARSPDGEEAPLEGVPRGTALLDLRPDSDGRLDMVIWADGTWPAQHVRARGLKLEAKAA
jgi:hypothetical protein